MGDQLIEAGRAFAAVRARRLLCFSVMNNGNACHAMHAVDDFEPSQPAKQELWWDADPRKFWGITISTSGSNHMHRLYVNQVIATWQNSDESPRRESSSPRKITLR